MSRICVHADIQTVPCAGSVFSRSIKCKAGLSNTCLRNCSEKCPAYRAAEYRKPTPTATGRSVLVPTFATYRDTNTKYQPTANTTTHKGGCAGCGK